MKYFKYIISAQLGILLFGIAYMAVSLLMDFSYSMVQDLIGGSRILDELYFIYSILEWLFSLPIVLFFTHFTAKGIAFENMNPWLAFVQSCKKLKHFILAIIPFYKYQNAEK